MQPLRRKRGDNHRKASRRAYRDLCRTLKVSGVSGAAEAREACTDAVADGLGEVLSARELTWDGYADGHGKLCERLCETYDRAAPGCGFTLGHAQKWVNMAAKYLVVLGNPGAVASMAALHVPVDSIVLREAAKPADGGGLGVASPFARWTAIGSYGEYLGYQEEIRKALDGGEPPLAWELEAWNRASGWRPTPVVTTSSPARLH